VEQQKKYQYNAYVFSLHQPPKSHSVIDTAMNKRKKIGCLTFKLHR